VSEHPIAYSIPKAVRAFDPPLSERAVRRAVRMGSIATKIVGKRRYIMRDELIRAAEAGAIK
jgi:hypothetical protein